MSQRTKTNKGASATKKEIRLASAGNFYTFTAKVHHTRRDGSNCTYEKLQSINKKYMTTNPLLEHAVKANLTALSGGVSYGV